jgi:signal transduction histidine kinase
MRSFCRTLGHGQVEQAVDEAQHHTVVVDRDETLIVSPVSETLIGRGRTAPGCARRCTPPRPRRAATRCCSNAWQATSSRTPCGTTWTGGWLEVCTGTADGLARLQVSSSGPEIPGDRVAELFEPFRRGPVARTADTPGSGLGLSIVRAVVQAHGGRAWADPVPGGGLMVTVELPVR